MKKQAGATVKVDGISGASSRRSLQADRMRLNGKKSGYRVSTVLRKKFVGKSLKEKASGEEEPQRKLGPGECVTFRDTSGRYITGVILEDDTLKVSHSNLVLSGNVMLKHPYWTWEKACRRLRDGSTLLKPREMVKFTKFFGSGWLTP